MKTLSFIREHSTIFCVAIGIVVGIALFRGLRFGVVWIGINITIPLTSGSNCGFCTLVVKQSVSTPTCCTQITYYYYKSTSLLGHITLCIPWSAPTEIIDDPWPQHHGWKPYGKIDPLCLPRGKGNIIVLTHSSQAKPPVHYKTNERS